MKFKKFTLVLVLVLCVGFMFPVYANDIGTYKVHQNIYQPRWANTDSVDIMLEKTSSGIEASVIIIPDNNEKIKGRLYLQKYTNGSWRTVKSWRFSGRDYTEVCESYSTSSGTYRAKVEVKVGSDNITMYSFEKKVN